MILPRVIGHRGIAALAPENTLAGFRRAAALGVAWVELDVQLTQDGVPVVFHDDELDRTTNGHGRLVECSAARLATLDAGSWFGADFAGEPVPSLAQAIAVIVECGLGLNLEIKADEALGARTAQAALSVARECWPHDRNAPLVSSFATSALEMARYTVPDWPRGWLVETLPATWRERVGSLGCVSLHTEHRGLERARAQEVIESGTMLLAYTVNRPERAAQLWNWGVQTVFSDDPTLLQDAVSSMML